MVDMIWHRYDNNAKPTGAYVTIPYDIFRGAGTLNQRLLRHLCFELDDLRKYDMRDLSISSEDGWIQVWICATNEYILSLIREE